ncbi:MAG: carotenoid biosynthesis protein [Bacteroidales bacterium]|nr:carotenoid biosynthesis protein [Bacteroidales bacterium]MDT8374668.1 carotenoid biosynthesis protein [Bacteroidales bacterium]
MRPGRHIEKSTGILLWVYGVGLAGMLLPFSRELFITITPLNLLFAALFLFYGRWPARRVLFTGLAVFAASFLVEAVGVNTGKIFGSYSYGSALGPKLWNTPVIIGLNWFVLIYCTNVISRQLWGLMADKLILGRKAAMQRGSAARRDDAQQPGSAASREELLAPGSATSHDDSPLPRTAARRDDAQQVVSEASPHFAWKSAFIIITGSLLMVLYDLFLEPAATRFDMWSWEGGIIPLRNYAGWFLFSALFHSVVRLAGEERINSRALPLFAVQMVFFAVTDIFYLLSEWL